MNEDPREVLRSLGYTYTRQVEKAKDVEQATLSHAKLSELPNMLAFRFIIEKWMSPSARGVGSAYQYVLVLPEIVINGSELVLGPFRYDELREFFRNKGVNER